jgi:hypothetical protein
MALDEEILKAMINEASQQRRASQGSRSWYGKYKQQQQQQQQEQPNKPLGAGGKHVKLIHAAYVRAPPHVRQGGGRRGIPRGVPPFVHTATPTGTETEMPEAVSKTSSAGPPGPNNNSGASALCHTEGTAGIGTRSCSACVLFGLSCCRSGARGPHGIMDTDAGPGCFGPALPSFF